MTPDSAVLFYNALPLDRDGMDRVARQRGELVSVCMSCRTAYDIKDPEGGEGGRSDGLCSGCFERDYADAADDGDELRFVTK